MHCTWKTDFTIQIRKISKDRVKLNLTDTEICATSGTRFITNFSTDIAVKSSSYRVNKITSRTLNDWSLSYASNDC